MRHAICVMVAGSARGLFSALHPTTTRRANLRLWAYPDVSDFSDVVAKYDAFLLDQFGVVHDGKTCYVGSAECMRELQEAGKRIVVLSNSSKRRRDTVHRLQKLKCGMCTFLDLADIVPGWSMVTQRVEWPCRRTGDLGVHLGRPRPQCACRVAAAGRRR